MKSTLLPSLLLAGLLVGSFAPAQAQTILLQIDYQNAPVFHVLDDGRLQLPTGAADGYVLTADSDGYATWQAVSGSGGAVTSDATLTGDGTPGSPLGVSVPLILSGGTNSGTIQGLNSNGSEGSLGNNESGVFGRYSNTNFGALGSYEYGVWGFHHGTNVGYLASADYGTYGRYGGSGPFGYLGSENYGAYGMHGSIGPAGYLGGTTYGAFGIHTNANAGLLGGNAFGVWGLHTNGSQGYLGHSSHGAFGQHPDGHYGSLGGSFYGVRGQNANANRAYLGHDDYGLWATGSPWAGYFAGNVHVTGTLSKAGGSFKIDHPLDPANRYLSHSFVESPEMKNVYDGTITTDAQGEAVVMLPDYFEALNRDFRYQLTVIGTFAQAIVAEEIRGNQFVIRTNEPGVKVSWQVTGIRQDAWANEHRIIVEEDKKPEDRGFYLHPRLYGQSETLRIGSVEDDPASLDHKAMQQHLDEARRKIDAERQRLDEERRRTDEAHQLMQADHERLQRQRSTPPDNRP